MSLGKGDNSDNLIDFSKLFQFPKTAITFLLSFFSPNKGLSFFYRPPFPRMSLIFPLILFFSILAVNGRKAAICSCCWW
jgi:hypothetical protein